MFAQGHRTWSQSIACLSTQVRGQFRHCGAPDVLAALAQKDRVADLDAERAAIGERFCPMDLLPGTSVSRWARSCRRSGLSRWGGGVEEDGSSTLSRSRSSARMRARAIRSRVAIAGGRGGDRGRQRPGLAAAGLAGEEPEAGLGGEPPEDSSEAHVGVPLLITSYATTRASGAENFGCISGCFLPYTRSDRPDRRPAPARPAPTR